MSLLRALAASARLARGQAMCAAPPAGTWGMGVVHAYPLGARIRAFASEAGFLDKQEVTDRVLEVVRKFEKVRPSRLVRL